MILICMAAGRNWKACAAHVGTRDSRAIASHAQKHFVRLCINGQALPAKVAQSGTGYTLSGKPLDPESAAAKAYGFSAGTLERETLNQLLLAGAPVAYVAACCRHRRLDHKHMLAASQAYAQPVVPAWRGSRWIMQRRLLTRRMVTAPMLAQVLLKVRRALVPKPWKGRVNLK